MIIFLYNFWVFVELIIIAQFKNKKQKTVSCMYLSFFPNSSIGFYLPFNIFPPGQVYQLIHQFHIFPGALSPLSPLTFCPNLDWSLSRSLCIAILRPHLAVFSVGSLIFRVSYLLRSCFHGIHPARNFMRILLVFMCFKCLYSTPILDFYTYIRGWVLNCLPSDF